MTIRDRVLTAVVVLLVGIGGAALAIGMAELLSVRTEPLE